MKHKLLFTFVALLGLLLIMVTIAAAAASYDLSWWTVDGGGGTSSGGKYSLSGTIGQPEVGPLLSNGGFTLTGGFWRGGSVTPAQHVVFLPLVIR